MRKLSLSGLLFIWTKRISFIKFSLYKKNDIIQNYKILPFFSDIVYSVYSGELYRWAKTNGNNAGPGGGWILAPTVSHHLCKYSDTILTLLWPRLSRNKIGRVIPIPPASQNVFINSIKLYQAPTTHVRGFLQETVLATAATWAVDRWGLWCRWADAPTQDGTQVNCSSGSGSVQSLPHSPHPSTPLEKARMAPGMDTGIWALSWDPTSSFPSFPHTLFSPPSPKPHCLLFLKGCSVVYQTGTLTLDNTKLASLP